MSSGRERVMNRYEVGTRTHNARLGVIRAELIRRIRPVCETMPDDLFFEMIDGMAAVQLKYELKETRVAP
jgi:hypothetical protein